MTCIRINATYIFLNTFKAGYFEPFLYPLMLFFSILQFYETVESTI